MIYKIYRDIVNYLTIRKTIKKAITTSGWNKHGLRVDWVYRIYAVINPTKYELGDEDVVLKQKMLEKTYPINSYIETLGISDLIAASWEQVPNTKSWLLVYYPIFNYLTVWRVTVFFTMLLIAGIITYSYIY